VGQVFPSPRARLAALDFLELGRFEGSSPAGEVLERHRLGQQMVCRSLRRHCAILGLHDDN
jgi:hypothetical protein